MQKIGDIPNTRADNNGEFTDGNVAGGVPPTILPAEWFNTIQRELMSILAAADIEADSDAFDQVLLSIQKLVSEGVPELKDASLTQKGIVQLSSSINSTSEALAATPKAVKTVNDAALQKSANLSDLANIATALSNLGIGPAGLLGVATNAQMAAGTSTSLLPTVAAVMSLFSKRVFTSHDYIRIPDVPGGLIIQWGFTPNLLTNTIGVANWSHPLPIPFPTACIVGTTTAAGTTSPLTSAANLSGIPNISGPVSTITGSVQNARNDQSVAIYYIAIGY
ncbi:bacteriophage tail fiber protein [Yersinia pseudotuberculosis]|uniref:tail fiber protein n=1 Tax=Yersinia pseudotuberculosis TaxID=633 RepID=UPI0004F68109|nr:phage tail protein [Yersinia pseudotuberculosis]AIN14271.1 phage tail fiber repeat family protein [Yersinia pseudotuberculosis]CNK93053.1 bacteriophage tail fiber protein [Yersinia pseudotuberculosis]